MARIFQPLRRSKVEFFEEVAPVDWSAAYDNRNAVPNAGQLVEKWAGEAEAFRKSLGARAEEHGYGPGARQRFDLFWPDGRAYGLAVYIHGGYWHRNGKDLWSHLAAGPLAWGWAVAVPQYTLCPENRVAGITAEVAQAIGRAAGLVPGPVRIAGHSAGGHLACRMICPGVLAPEVLARVAGVLSISGLHDLRPLIWTDMNAVLRLDPEEARTESPALMMPAARPPVTAWVGGAELPELRRQSALIANIWQGCGVATTLVEAEGHDHFTVIEPLADPMSGLTDAWLGLESEAAPLAVPPSSWEKRPQRQP